MELTFEPLPRKLDDVVGEAEGPQSCSDKHEISNLIPNNDLECLGR